MTRRDRLMRPEILNPLFAEVEVLKGVGPQVAQAAEAARPDPRGRCALSSADGLRSSGCARNAANANLLGRNVILELTPFETREITLGARPDARVRRRCRRQHDQPHLFQQSRDGRSAACRRARSASSRASSKQYGDEWQIIHPEVAEPGKGPAPAIREPVYPLTEGLTNRRMGELAREALERAPELPEWIEPSLAARECWRAWRASLAEAHREPGADDTRKRLAYDEIFANQLALLLLRQSQRRRRTVPLAGTGELTDRLQLPYQLTGAQRRVIEEIRGDLAQSTPMLRLLQGDVGSGKTLVALLAMLAAVESGAQAAMLAPTEILARQHHATLLGQLDSIGVRVAILTGREKGKAREMRPDGACRRLDRHPRRHPRDLPGEGRLQESRPRGDRRAAPLRRVAAAAARRPRPSVRRTCW